MKIVLALLLIVVAVFSLPWWCIAASDDGNKLLAQCGAAVAAMDNQQADSNNSSTAFDMGFCLGLMQGLLDMNNVVIAFKGAAPFCQPKDTSIGQAARIVVKYLRDHPEELHLRDSALATIALRNAFPCTDKK